MKNNSVILSPSTVTLSVAKGLRVNSAKDLQDSSGFALRMTI